MGDDLDNLTWVFNGNETHTWQTNQAVYRALKEASDEAISEGAEVGSVRYKNAIKEALEAIGEKLGKGETLF